MFENMKIGPKLYCLIGFSSCLLIAIGALGLRGMKISDDSLESLYQERLLPVALLSNINDLRRENIQELLLAQFHDPLLPASKIHEADHPVTMHTDRVEANRSTGEKLWEQYLATSLTLEEKKLADRYAADQDKYKFEGEVPAIEILKQRRFNDAGQLITKTLVPRFKETEQAIDALVTFQVSVAREAKQSADFRYASTRNLAMASIALGIFLALGIGYWIIRNIIGRIKESVSVISSSATQISSTVTQQERTASQQSAAANQTSATIEELSASSRQSAEQAANAASVTEKAGSATIQGSNSTQQTVVAMGNLKEKITAMAEHILYLGDQSGQIGTIATVLKDLAGQINMLALNAAVEAARAGEHGRGFAVVAGEIRKLADQSRKSAEQTALLVADIQKATNASIMMTEDGNYTVGEATQLVQNVAELFTNLTSLTSTANENAQQVMLNAKQQAAAFGQVVEAINSIAAGARETAAGISQTKIGIQTLTEVSNQLKAIA